MMNKVLKAVLWFIGLACLITACWFVAMYRAWPLWAVAPLMLAVGLALWLAGVLRRRWIAWRLRRRLARDMPVTVGGMDVAPFDQQWKAGLQVLRDARLGGRRESLYALPWLLAIDVGSSAGDEALRTQSIRRIDPDPVQPLAALAWYFLKSCVVLGSPPLPAATDDTATGGTDGADGAGGTDSTAAAPATVAWKRLLYRLVRTRRREPLNGLVINLELGWLLQADESQLARAGQALRARHDDLTRIYNVRIPVWIVLTRADQIPGFHAWTQLLDAPLRSQPFGYTVPAPQHDDQDAPDFVQAAFASVLDRLAELRLALGAQTTLSAPVFELPQRIADLQVRLERVLVPAFDATPYAATPLLRGLYWAGFSQAGGVQETWFSSDLYEHVFPLQRHTWVGLDRLGAWRRVVYHTAVAAWAGVCVAAVIGLLYASHDVRRIMDTLASRQLEQLDFSGSLESDLQALNIWHDATVNLARSRQGLSGLLPLRSHLATLESHYKKEFARLYKDEIKRDFMDQMVINDLPGVVRNGTETEIAAWTQYLVRRINMIRARLAGRSLDGVPVPGPELAQLYHSEALRTVGLQTAVLMGQLYTDYLLWQPERAQLQGELDGLGTALRQLNLGTRDADWLLAWAEFQSDLRAITLSDFWGVPVPASAPHVPAGLTRTGIEAITDFVTELAHASGDTDAWEQRHEAMGERFERAAYDAWYAFVAGFDDGRQYLDDERAWRLILSSAFTRNDPYLKLLAQLNDLFSLVPVKERPGWTAAAINLQQILLAAEATRHENPDLLDQLRTANTLGHAGLQAVSQGASLEQTVASVREGLAAVEEMKAYGDQLGLGVRQLLQGQGAALELARQTWSYGHDPEARESPLHEARAHFKRMRQHVGGEHAREEAVWALMYGPLSFALDYTARSAACGLQKDWDANVLGAVQNVRSQVLAHDLLYGERGSVPAFMQGVVSHFIERDANGFGPREALGQTLPLSGEFYAYVSGIQLKQIRHTEQGLRDQYAEKSRAAQIEALQQQQADLDKQAQAMESLGGVVEISAGAPLVNTGARILPQRTTLSLQCSSGTTVLENYNFPSQASFNWSPGTCGDAVIRIQFPEFTLSKAYEGPNGFIDLLREFSAGQRRFGSEEFPLQRADMDAAGISEVTLTWRMQGQTALLDNQSRADRLAADMAQVRQQLHSLREQQAGTPPDQQLVTDIRDMVPEQITAPCWRSRRTASVARQSDTASAARHPARLSAQQLARGLAFSSPPPAGVR